MLSYSLKERHVLDDVFLTATDDPPRPTFDSVLSRDMAGYMPARADFMEVSWSLKLN